MHFFTSIFSGTRANKKTETSTVFTKDGSITLTPEAVKAAAKKAEEDAAAAAAKKAEEDAAAGAE